MMSASVVDVEPNWPISIRGVSLKLAPFRHMVVPTCIADAEATRLLDWFENDAPWRLVETDFYAQYEFCLWDTPDKANVLTNSNMLCGLRGEMARAFGCEFEERVNVVAHKLTPGQRIEIHNDHLLGEETHRLILQLNRELRDEDGGLFMLFNSDNASDVNVVLRPVHRSALAFEISADSFHAVSRMHNSVRYTLIFSFYRKQDQLAG